MKKIIIAILSTMLMTQSIVPVIAEGTLITSDEISGIEDLEESEKIDENEITQFSSDSVKIENSNDINDMEREEDVSKISDTINNAEGDTLFSTEIQSATEFSMSRMRPNHIIEYAKKFPSTPNLGVEVITVTQFSELKSELESKKNSKVRLGGNITYAKQSDSRNRITIPDGYSKELDLNTYTINALDNGQIVVNGDYFKMKNGTVIGGYGNNSGYIPSEDSRGGFIYTEYKISLSRKRENDLVFENIRHENTHTRTDRADALGGFLVATASNVFFTGNNTLLNGNYNIKAGSITFMDGKFEGKVTNQTEEYSGWDSYTVGTTNISWHGWATKVQKDPSGPERGDKRIYVKEGAEVELHNLNNNFGNPPNSGGAEMRYRRYTNNIANFSVITVEGSLKMYGTYTPLRTIIPEVLSNSDLKDPYGKSTARTYNGMANINVLEGATLTAEATQTDNTQGVLFSYNTTLNVEQPEVVDLFDRGTNTFNPVFHAGKKMASSINVYDAEMSFWSMNLASWPFPTITRSADVFENSGFYTFLLNGEDVSKYNERGRTDRVEPYDPVLQELSIVDYSRIRIEGDGPVIVPDNKFKWGTDYRFGNGDNEFYGKAYYRKKDSSGNLIPIKNGDVILQDSSGTLTAFKTTTDNQGNWKFDFSKLNNYERAKVGLNYLTVTEKIEGKTSRKTNVYVTDTIPPEGASKLLKIEEGDLLALRNAKLSVEWARDETTSDNRLIYEYLNLSDIERRRIINTVGLHQLKVSISDEAGNQKLLDAPVRVYPKGTDPNKQGYVEGYNFEIDKNIFLGASQDEKRQFVIDYGEAKAYELGNQGYNDVTNDKNKFFIHIGNVSSDGKSVPIRLSLMINGKEEDYLNIKAILIDDSMIINFHFVEPYTYANEAPGKPKIYSDLTNKKQTSIVKTYYKRPSASSESINVLKLMEKLNNENRLQMDYLGYNRFKKMDGQNEITDFAIHYTTDTFGYNHMGQNIEYNNMFHLVQADVYVRYNPQIFFSEVPNLTYGEIQITDKKEETHELERTGSGGTTVTETNRATIINTAKKEKWSVNLAVENNKIASVNGEEFLGGLVYYKNGQEVAITGSPITLESYQAPNKNNIDLIKDINFYSQNTNEGIRLKQRIGNTVGNYSGDLIWTLTDSPIP